MNLQINLLFYLSLDTLDSAITLFSNEKLWSLSFCSLFFITGFLLGTYEAAEVVTNLSVMGAPNESYFSDFSHFLNSVWYPDLVVPDLQSCHIFRVTLQTASLRISLKLDYQLFSIWFNFLLLLLLFFFPLLLFKSWKKPNKYPREKHSWKVRVHGATLAIKIVCRARFPVSRCGVGISPILISDVCKLFKSVLVTQFSLHSEGSLQTLIHSLASRFNLIKGLYNPL